MMANTDKTLIWSDEFDYEGAPDPGKWSFQTGAHGWGNGEVQAYTDRTDPENANAWVSGGKLKITLRPENYEGKDAFTSARINTCGKFSFTYGRVEIRAKLPKGGGTWPAVWMMPESIRAGDKWPHCGEIDIIEHTGSAQDEIFMSLHTGKQNHVIGNQLTKTVMVDGVSDDFHDYALDWTEDGISYEIDGVQMAVFRRSEALDYPFDKPFFLIANLAFGGGFGGKIDPSCLPAVLELDYIRVYKV